MKRPSPAAAREVKGRAPAGQAKVKERIDVALVARGLCESREKAARLLLAGAVTVDGKRVDKPGTLVAPGAELRLTAKQKFVSRGGDKLSHALEAFAVSPKQRVCLDVGASTGGFTQCLLEAGATRGYAVDVGQGQLDASLRADGRVVVMEKTHDRQLSSDALPDAPHLPPVAVTIDSGAMVIYKYCNERNAEG